MTQSWKTIPDFMVGRTRRETVARTAALLSVVAAGLFFGVVARAGSTSSLPATMPAWSLEALNLPEADHGIRSLFEVPVTITGYSSTVGQTDETPFVTASNTRVRQGIIALSRDLLREYTPGAPFSFGDHVQIDGVGAFEVEDTMNRRYTRRVDIWFGSRAEALRWGRQRGMLARHIPDPLERFEEVHGSPFEIPEHLGGLHASFRSAPYD